jgi:hypothetical protein
MIASADGIARQITSLKGRLTACDRERLEIAERLGGLERTRADDSKQWCQAAVCVTTTSLTSEKIALFWNLFRQRENALSRRWDKRNERDTIYIKGGIQRSSGNSW